MFHKMTFICNLYKAEYIKQKETIGKYLQGNSIVFSKSTTRRVQATARDLQYRRNKLA